MHFDLSTNGGATSPEAYNGVSGSTATSSANGFTAGNAGTTYTMYADVEDNLGQWSSQISNTVTVVKQGQTINFSNPGTQTYGVGPFGLSASATSGLGVTFSIVSGPATVSGSTITITGAGTVTVAANQGGNVNYNAAAQVTQSFTVAGGAQTITFANPGTQIYGVAPFGLSASATSGLPVTFSIVSGPATVSGSTITITGTGTVTVAANQAGNAGWTAAPQVTQSFAVNQATQTISFGNPGPQTYGAAPFVLTASASSGLPVTLTVASGPATISGSTLTINGVGTVVIDANQAGNAYFSAAPQVQQSFSVNQASQTISFTNPGTQTYGVAPIGLTASASSGLPVTFSIVSGPATVSGSTLTVTGAGTVVVAANQAGNADYGAAPQVTATFTVNQAPQTVSISPPTQTVVQGASITFTASGAQNGYTWGGSSGATGAVVNFPNLGTFTVTVQSPAGGNYALSNLATATITVVAPATISVTGATNFGTVRPFTGAPRSSTSTFTISNSGGIPLTVSAASVAGAYSITSINGGAPSYPFVLAAGASVPMVVTFTPTAMGTSTTNLVIANTSSNSPNYTLALTGLGAEGIINISWDAVH